VRVAVLCPDLLFGSRLEGMLKIAGHEVALAPSEAAAIEAAAAADAVVIDLTTDQVDGIGFVGKLRARRELDGLPLLGFYAHVDQEVRRRAERAGIDRIVPRSRMNREGAALVEALVAPPGAAGPTG
jgi:CheY-like chemotaxis protein